VTGCIEGRLCLLGEVQDGTVNLSPDGRAVVRAWEDLPKHYPQVKLDAFVAMPNHIHGVIELLYHSFGPILRSAPGLGSGLLSSR
jgi:putative transposase